MFKETSVYEMWQVQKEQDITIDVALGKSVSQISLNKNPLYRQNAMYAGKDDKGIYHPIGHYIRNGKLTKYYKDLPWSAFVIPNVGFPYIKQVDISKLTDVKMAFYLTPSILKDGKVLDNSASEKTASDIKNGSAYRSIIAISNWGYVALIKTKVKMTLKQAGQLAKDLGYYNAGNMDGGGSVSGGKGAYKPAGYERPISNAIIITGSQVKQEETKGGDNMRENDIQLSKNLKLYELECKDGSHQVVTFQELVDCFQKLRDRVGQALIINSGYRTPAYNKSIGGVADSQHLLGKAMDIKLPKGLTVDQFAILGREAGFTGIGKYPWGCHFDIGKARIFDER